jgi:hypothetical protein
MIYWLAMSLMLCFGDATPAPNRGINLSGHWKGTITQKEGGYRPTYVIEFYLSQQGTSIKGQSYVYADDIHAVMALEGELKNNMLLQFHETKIVDFTKTEDVEWCIKKGQLVIRQKAGQIHLEGFWQGDSVLGPCVPGEIYLEKVKQNS